MGDALGLAVGTTSMPLGCVASTRYGPLNDLASLCEGPNFKVGVCTNTRSPTQKSTGIALWSW